MSTRHDPDLRITTPLCTLLDIEHPIISAPMAGHAGPALASAVSAAGGLGMIGVDPGTEPDALRAAIREVRDSTERTFGVGFISCFPGVERLVATAIDERVPVISHSFSDPTPYVGAARDGGVRTIAQVQKVDHARVALAAGVDVVVAQGISAGGHTGHVGTVPLGLSVIDIAGSTPVVLAGGFADGRGLAAALVLGAAGVWMGTRFVASEEAEQPRWMKQQVAGASADDTVLTKVYDLLNRSPFPSDIGDRVLRNDFTDTWHGREDDLVAGRSGALSQLSGATGSAQVRVAPNRAGCAAGQVRSVESAGSIMRTIIAEATNTIRERPVELLVTSDATAPGTAEP